MIKSEKGFTLIEVVAVLVILGILVAVAMPRYVELIKEAKKFAAGAEVAEMKSTLNLSYAKYFISSGAAATNGGAIIMQAGLSDGNPQNIGTSPDIWNVTLSSKGKAVEIAVNSRGTPPDEDYKVTGTWNLPD